MNTLDDLRRTLDQHAADVANPATVVRTAAVHHRVAAIRRRRRAVGSGALALVLLARVATALWPRQAGNSLPAAPVVLGQQAPTTFPSLGYTYRTDGTAESGPRRAAVVVTKSDQPQLYSWATDGAADVRVEVPTGEVWHSRLTDFRDFVVLPPGTSGNLEASVPSGRVAITRYTLTSAAPEGYTRDGVTYRQIVGSRPLLTATLAAPGATEASTTVVAPAGQTLFATLCTGVPKGYAVQVSVDGKAQGAGDCSDPDTFDPASAGGYSTRLARPGKTVTVRVFVTHGLKSHRPVTGPLPHLRLGLGLYGPYDGTSVRGNRLEPVIEHDGHTWSLGRVYSSSGRPLHIPAAGEDRLGSMVWAVRTMVRATFHAQGETVVGGEFFAPGPGGVGNLWIPSGSAATARLAHDKGPFAVVLYNRAD